MKMNKVTQFLKQNVFYISMGIVIIGALVAVLFLPKEGNVPPDSNIKNEQAGGNVSDDYEGAPIIVDDALPTDDAMTSEEEAVTNDESVAVDENNEAQEETQGVNESAENVTSDNSEGTTSEIADEELNTQTFASTTADESTEPFFADGDTFAEAVEGSTVVPYTDDSTKYWFSDTLNQTMRTYGVCLAANEGEEVKAVAKGIVTDIVTDSSTLEGWDMPYVGKVMIVDLGNGYKVAYGFQGGTPDESLKGQLVNAGDILGTVGSPVGPFVAEGENIYLQLTHDDEVIDPTNYFEVAQN